MQIDLTTKQVVAVLVDLVGGLTGGACPDASGSVDLENAFDRMLARYMEDATASPARFAFYDVLAEIKNEMNEASSEQTMRVVIERIDDDLIAYIDDGMLDDDMTIIFRYLVERWHDSIEVCLPV